MEEIPDEWVIMIDDENRIMVQEWRETFISKEWKTKLQDRLDIIYVRNTGSMGCELCLIYKDAKITTKQFVEQVLKKSYKPELEDNSYLINVFNKLGIK